MEKLRYDELTDEQVSELESGPHSRTGTAFASEDERRAAWKAHGAELVAGFEGEAVRPWGYWAYDPQVPPELRDVKALGRRLRIPGTDLEWWAGRGFDELDRRRRAWLT